MFVYYVTKGEETERITQDEKYLWCLKMNNLQQTPRKNRPLVTITPYNEQEKRVINGTIANGSSPPPPPPAPPLPLPSKSRHNSDDSVEMQSIDSFKLKDTPNTTIPKPPPIYFPVANAQTVSTTISANESPRHTVQIGNKSQVPQPVPQQINGNRDKPRPMAQELSPKTAVSPTKSTVVGKVAIRIGAYEGETKQPSKLDFLSQQPRSPTFVDGKNGYNDQLANGPVVSRLQNELAATLQRSNLRKKTETDNGSGVKGNSEDSMMSNCEDTMTPEIGKLPQSSLDKLASALGNKVTIKVSPENGNR